MPDSGEQAAGSRRPRRGKPAVVVQIDRASDVEGTMLARHQGAVVEEVLQWLSQHRSDPGAAPNGG